MTPDLTAMVVGAVAVTFVLPAFAFLAKWVFAGTLRKLDEVVQKMELIADKGQKTEAQVGNHRVELDSLARVVGRLEGKLEGQQAELSEFRTEIAELRTEAAHLRQGVYDAKEQRRRQGDK